MGVDVESRGARVGVFNQGRRFESSEMVNDDGCREREDGFCELGGNESQQGGSCGLNWLSHLWPVLCVRMIHLDGPVEMLDSLRVLLQAPDLLS